MWECSFSSSTFQEFQTRIAEIRKTERIQTLTPKSLRKITTTTTTAKKEAWPLEVNTITQSCEVLCGVDSIARTNENRTRATKVFLIVLTVCHIHFSQTLAQKACSRLFQQKFGKIQDHHSCQINCRIHLLLIKFIFENQNIPYSSPSCVSFQSPR